MPHHPAASQVLGPHFYLFRSPTPAKRLIITAHGQEMGSSERVLVPLGSQVRFFAAPRRSMVDPQLLFVAAGFVHPAEVVGWGNSMPVYFIGKYDEDHYARVAHISRNYGVDIVTVRNRRGFRADQTDTLTTADLFQALRRADLVYPVIDAVHCRTATPRPIGMRYPLYDFAHPETARLMFKAQRGF